MLISKEANIGLATALSVVLADATVMYHRAHGFHWNVIGPDFPEWHAKFEEIYDDVWESLDGIAENIRKIGGTAPFRLGALASIASVSDDLVVDFTPPALVADLLATNAGVLASLNTAYQVASAANQQGVVNFLAGRIEMHDKWAWQLSASL